MNGQEKLNEENKENSTSAPDTNSKGAFFETFEGKTKEKDIKVFENEEVFKPNYVPNELYFREKELSRLGEYLKPLNEGMNPEDLSVYGQTGTGKTAVVKYVKKQIDQRFKDRLDINMVYVGCRDHTTKRSIYSEIANEIRPNGVSKTGHSTDKYFEFIKEHLKEHDGVLVVILDEIDFLQRDNEIDVEHLIYKFTDKNDISMVVVSNNRKWKEEISDQRVFSRMGISEMDFSGYSQRQLREILLDRAEKGLNSTIWNIDIIDEIADKAVSGDGDARIAIKILHQSAKIFSKELSDPNKSDVQMINSEHVREASKLVESNRLYTNYIYKLPVHKKMVLCAVAKGDNDGNTLDDVYDNYKYIVETANEKADDEHKLKPKSKSTVWRYTNELKNYGFVSKEELGKGGRGRSSVVMNTTFDSEKFIDKWNNTDEIIENFRGEWA